MLNIQIGVSCEQLKDGRDWSMDNWLLRCSVESFAVLKVDLQMSGRDALARGTCYSAFGKLIFSHMVWLMESLTGISTGIFSGLFRTTRE
jgi:hypothetical protein